MWLLKGIKTRLLSGIRLFRPLLLPLSFACRKTPWEGWQEAITWPQDAATFVSTRQFPEFWSCDYGGGTLRWGAAVSNFYQRPCIFKWPLWTSGRKSKATCIHALRFLPVLSAFLRPLRRWHTKSGQYNVCLQLCVIHNPICFSYIADELWTEVSYFLKIIFSKSKKKSFFFEYSKPKQLNSSNKKKRLGYKLCYP